MNNTYIQWLKETGEDSDIYRALDALVEDICNRATTDNRYEIDGRLLEAAHTALGRPVDFAICRHDQPEGGIAK